MRKLFLLILTLSVCTTMWAVPAKRGLHTFTQTDGTKIQVELVGDEFCHSFLTTDGLTVDCDDNGDFYYSRAGVATTVRAHNVAERSATEQAFVEAERDNLSMAARLMGGTTRMKAKSAAPIQKAGQTPCTGAARVPILLVEYSDKKMANTKASFETFFNGTGTSCKRYFEDQSNNKYQPQFDVYGVYTLSGTRATYGGNDSSGNDKGLGRMVEQAIQAAVAEGEIDWSVYDNDKDGYCDVVIVMYAGVGEAQSGLSNSVWPCQWNLYSAKAYGYGDVGDMTYNGVTISKFAVFNEINGSTDSSTKLDGIGTFCHEYSHCLGQADFYVTSGSSNYFGMDSWSLMDYGCYNNNGYTPIGYSAYEKEFFGWLDVTEGQKNTKYTLPVLNSGNDKAVRLTSSVNKNERYYLEYRKKQGWDKYIPAEGILISHCSYIASRWAANTVNNNSVQLMTIAPADNSLTTSSVSKDLWPQSTKTDFTDETSPAAKLFLTSGGTASGNAGLLGKPVTEMAINSDGTASFWVMKSDFEAYTPEMKDPDESKVTGTSFVAEWSDATPSENVLSYTLKVKENGEQLVTEVDFADGFPDGWTKSSSGVGSAPSGGYFQIGSGSYGGYIRSPKLDLSGYGGEVTVQLVCKAYSSDSDVPLNVVLQDASYNVLSTQTIKPGSDDQTFTVSLTGGDEDCYVVFQSSNKKKRTLLKSFKIYSGTPIAASAPAKVATETGDATSRTITGITDKTYEVKDLNEGKTYNYMVKAVYTNGEESGWSNMKTVELKAGSVTPGDIDGDGSVDVSDVTTLISLLLNGGAGNIADVNGDGEVNIADVTTLIQIILNNQ